MVQGAGSRGGNQFLLLRRNHRRLDEISKTTDGRVNVLGVNDILLFLAA